MSDAVERVLFTSILVPVFVSGLVCFAQRSKQNISQTGHLVSDFARLHHSVSTKNAKAQDLFDQGLTFIYALDNSGAAKIFERAAALDPNMAMAYWGMAYALGSDYYYSTPGEPGRERAAHDALDTALKLSARGPEAERAYITALSKRYCDCANPNRQQQALNFKNAMHDLARNYPDDPDAATLYAQSIMNLSPWALWNADGTPREGTTEIFSVLESVLKRDPHHIGAMHYYIHAIEGSPNPERALAYAALLPTLAPSIGHIVHMPAHIYMRTGDYPAAEDACQKASQIDERYLQSSSRVEMFTIFSYLHDLYFLGAAASMDGHYSVAKKAVNELANLVGPHLRAMPQLESFLIIQPSVLVRFAQWKEILKLPEPTTNLRIADSMWHFARGMAFAATGNVADAETEYKAVTKMLEATATDEAFGMSANKAQDILKIASDILAAKLAMAKNERSVAVTQLREAVAIQDSLKYAEPPSWLYPVRESLGAALFLDEQVPAAETVFREDLQKNPRNPRSLFGLLKVLKSRRSDYGVGFVQAEFNAAWKGDVQELELRDF